jgi:septal ring factor EnvC (AmiA/AmiB activator)
MLEMIQSCTSKAIEPLRLAIENINTKFGKSLQDIQDLKDKLKKAETIAHVTNRRIDILEEQLDAQQQRGRRNGLHFSNVPVTSK